MTGWKTMTAGVGMVLYGIAGALAGYHGLDQAVTYVMQGLAVLGIGHKLDKQTHALKGD